MIVKNNEINIEVLGNGVSRKILAHEGKMMMVEVHFDKGAIGAIHSHYHEQSSYVLSGSFEVTIEGEKEIIKAGDTFYIKTDLMHGVLALENSVILDVFTPQRDDFLKKQ